MMGQDFKTVEDLDLEIVLSDQHTLLNVLSCGRRAKTCGAMNNNIHYGICLITLVILIALSSFLSFVLLQL